MDLQYRAQQCSNFEIAYLYQQPTRAASCFCAVNIPQTVTQSAAKYIDSMPRIEPEVLYGQPN